MAATDNRLPPAIELDGLAPELLNQFLQNQAKEIELRQSELQLKQQEDTYDFEIMRATLQAKTTDRQSEREHDGKTQKTRLIFSGTVILIITSLLAYALALGKDAFAMEVIKAVLYILSGGVGGFAIGKTAADKKSPKHVDME